MITETTINCFFALTRTLSYTKAAEELYMTQQAVSQNISKMEADLGIKLFIRGPHSVRLTESGALYAACLQENTNRLRALVSELRAKQEKGSPFRVGISDHPDFLFLQTFLSGHIETLIPGRAIELHASPPGVLLAKLRKQELDIAFLLERHIRSREGFCIQPVLKIGMALFVSPKHPALRENAVYEDFMHDPMIIVGQEKNDRYFNANEFLALELARANISPSGLTMVKDDETAVSVASAGKGVLLHSLTNQLSADYNLVPVPIPNFDAVFVGVWEDYLPSSCRELCAKIEAFGAEKFPQNQ